MSTNDKLREALMKLKAAQTAHPRAVTVLVEEAHDLIDMALAASKPEPTRSQKMKDAGFSARTGQFGGCDECGKDFNSILQAQLHSCKPEPQAQAAEPEVVYAVPVSVAEWAVRYIGSANYESREREAMRHIRASEGKYITLQSHREAMVKKDALLATAGLQIAKKDAALDACVEALGTCRIVAKDDNGNYTREVTPKIITDAITKAQEARK